MVMKHQKSIIDTHTHTHTHTKKRIQIYNPKNLSLFIIVFIILPEALKVKVAQAVRLFPTSWTIQSMFSLGQDTGMGSCSLLQGVSPTQGLNPGLPHCRGILCQLSHSVQFSHSIVSDSLQPQELQHARPPCPSPTPGVCPNSRPLSR